MAFLHSHPGLAFSQGLGIGAHSRKHILVSPGGQGKALSGWADEEGARSHRDTEEQAAGQMHTDDACRKLASHAGHSTRSPAPENPQVGAPGFSHVSPTQGGWIPFFAFSLPTLATAGCTSRRGLI